MIPVPELGPGEVLVEVAGCSLCHRDLNTAGDEERDGGPTLSALQIPGHDISGKVVGGAAAWIGREVLIPAFSSGRHNGFSTHVSVTTADLLEIKNRKAFPSLAHLSAAVDTLAAPFQAVNRAGMISGDKVIVLGLDGQGLFLVQLAKTLGCETVVAVDTSSARLKTIQNYGADLVIHADAKTTEEVAAELAQIQGKAEQRQGGWKVFVTPCSGLYLNAALSLASQVDKILIAGSAAVGQESAVDALAAGGADIIEPRGCPPEDFPKLIEWVVSGAIALGPFLLTRPMSWIKQVFATVRQTAPERRIVFTPDDFGLEDEQEGKSCR